LDGTFSIADGPSGFPMKHRDLDAALWIQTVRRELRQSIGNLGVTSGSPARHLDSRWRIVSFDGASSTADGASAFPAEHRELGQYVSDSDGASALRQSVVSLDATFSPDNAAS
jgi:hypothetical protein